MRNPAAEWHPVPSFSKTDIVRPARGLVLHVIVGSLGSAENTFLNAANEVSAHFGVGRDGRLVQWVDTDFRAWAEAAGNPEWISVETEGMPDEPLTVAQMETIARLLLWLSQQYGFPLQVTDDVHSRGFTSHRCGGAAWGNHPCPGDLRHAQRGAIVDRAIQLAGRTAPSAFPQEGSEDMQAVIDTKGTPINGLTPMWEVDEQGNTFAWNGARPLPTVNSYTTVHPKIVQVAPHPSGDGVVCFGDDRRIDGGKWVRSSYALLVQPH